MTKKLETLDDIQKLLWRFAEHRVVTVAGRTGILRALAQGYATPESIAAALDLDPLATGKIVRALTALGLAVAEGDTYSIHQPLAAYFTPGPTDLTPFMAHSHDLYEKWGEHLEAWVRGTPWTTQTRDPAGVEKFGKAMRAMGSGVAEQVAAALDLSRDRRMLDVGGGFGHYSEVLLNAYPNLTAEVLDTEAVTALGRKRIAQTPLAERLGFKAGDYNDEDWGKDHDLVLLANVIHQEPAPLAAAMIRRAAAAARGGGRVAVVDFSIDDEQRAHVIGALFAINMRSFGDTYTESVIRDWMHQAGLTDVQKTDISDFRWLIVGHKPA
ncbi:MAG: methyltransferase [Myxococcota bacterium]|nr:methyltransferase [Myxococcota bacterium]